MWRRGRWKGRGSQGEDAGVWRGDDGLCQWTTVHTAVYEAAEKMGIIFPERGSGQKMLLGTERNFIHTGSEAAHFPSPSGVVAEYLLL